MHELELHSWNCDYEGSITIGRVVQIENSLRVLRDRRRCDSVTLDNLITEPAATVA